MKASISEHRITSGAILAVAAWVTYVSYTGEPSGAFLFPRIIATIMIVLAAWNFYRAITGVSKIGEGVTLDLAKTIAPGVAVLIIYIFFAATFFGFYVSSLAAFIALYALYDPANHTSIKSWVKRAFAALVFMVVIYGLFNVLLKVQTPRGLFF